MADNAQGNAPQQIFEIQRIYLKDASFESPGAPQVFTRQFQPTVTVDLDTDAQQVADNVYDVELRITTTVKLGDEVAYLVEVKQAGIFGIAGYDEAQLGQLLGAYCPTVIFPYAREAISDLAVKGGFPQLLLAPVNFDALYMQKLQQAQQGGAQ